MPGLSDTHEVRLETPFGNPSDAYVLGTLDGRKVAFLSRHGRGHRILPQELNFRANIYGFKHLGVERILPISAVGSMTQELAPGQFVIPDQFVDRTKARVSTFFGDGIVGHVAFADPICPEVAGVLDAACAKAGVEHTKGGTYICIEGPQFSTKAESNLYRSWGMDVVGMTVLQEAKLAREAEICYAALAMVTDYDCWHPSHDSVTVEQVVAVAQKNAANAQTVVMRISHQVPPAHHMTKLLESFAADVKQRTNGQVDVQLYGSEQLAKAAENFPAVARGTIEAAMSVNFQWGTTIPEMSATLIPYAMGDLEKIKRFPQSEARKFLDQKLE
jgi:5'-methylthioadenosine phosphorylase